MRLVQLSRHSITFPSPEGALREPNGLLALGDSLNPACLLMAYQHGISSWFSPGDLTLRWSPDPWAVLWSEQFRLSHSVKRFHQRSSHRITLNHIFGEVTEGCISDRNEGTWIASSIVRTYHQLHELDHIRSIEVWQENTLVGGTYGTAWGMLFHGELMFSRAEDTSKTILLVFCQAFMWSGGKLADYQILNNHTALLDAVGTPRRGYLNYPSVLRGYRLPELFWVPRVLFPGAQQKCFQHTLCQDGIIVWQSSFYLLPRRRLGTIRVR